MDDALSKHVLEAKIGGIPSIANRIRGYMNIVLKRSGVWITPKLEVRAFFDALSVYTQSHLFLGLLRCCMTFPSGRTYFFSSAQVALMSPWNLSAEMKRCSRPSHSLYTFCKNTSRTPITCRHSQFRWFLLCLTNLAN